MKAMMTAVMTAAIKRRLFIFLPSACLWGLGLLWLGSQGAPSIPGSGRRGHRAQRGQGPTRQWCGVCKAGVPPGLRSCSFQRQRASTAGGGPGSLSPFVCRAP